MAGKGTGIYTLATYGPTGQSRELTAGVKFADIAGANRDIVAIEQPALTPAELETMRSYLLDTPPIPALQAPSEVSYVPRSVAVARSQMDEFLAAVAAITSRTHAHDNGHVAKRLIKHGFFDDERKNLAIAIEWARGAQIAGIEAIYEDPTVDRGGYLIKIHLA